MDTFEEWKMLSIFLKSKLFDKGMGAPDLWLSLNDRESEGTWKDFFTNRILQNYTPPWKPGEPNGQKRENCVLLEGEGTWVDITCNVGIGACIVSLSRTLT